MNWFSKTNSFLSFFKMLFNPIMFKEYLDDLNRRLKRELKRREHVMYSYNQSFKKLSKYRTIPEYIYKSPEHIMGISTTSYSYNPKKTKKRRLKNKIKHR